ncbi:MAG: phosphoribosyltransferase [Parcubacteria group bacterium]
MQNILEQMRDRIDNKEYKLIIGDDASGRIPTFIFRKFLKKVYGKEDAKKLQTLFFAGFGAGGELRRKINLGENGLVDKKQKMSDFISQHSIKLNAEERVLLVTDTINTGSSIKPMIEALQALGYAVDVATVGVCKINIEDRTDLSDEEKTDSLKEKFNCDVFVGLHEPPEIWGKDELNGVFKFEKDLHSTIIASVARDKFIVDKKVSLARRAANEVADELAEWYAALSSCPEFNSGDSESDNAVKKSK